MFQFPFDFKQGSVDTDINQDFQDAIDVMQRHSEIFYDTGILKITLIFISIFHTLRKHFSVCV